MCTTCGCSEDQNSVTIRTPDTNGKDAHEAHPSHSHHHHNHNHAHGHSHHHHHHDHDGKGRTLLIEEDILARNNHIASHNREHFSSHSLFVLNLVSSPGSGKTTLLEKTLSDNHGRIPFAVIEGDQQTMRDAERINATGVPVVQVNTGTGCHLDADMISRAAERLPLQENSVLFIENVGNLVCPALFDLGEAHKVVVISVTEGHDKPLKYPTMFAAADVCVINKIDLLPYVDFDMKACREDALRVNHHLRFFEVSAKTGEGMQEWYQWLREKTANPSA